MTNDLSWRPRKPIDEMESEELESALVQVNKVLTSPDAMAKVSTSIRRLSSNDPTQPARYTESERDQLLATSVAIQARRLELQTAARREQESNS